MAKAVEYLNALPAGSRLEEYEFLSVLGSGGFGVTYKGFDHLLGKTVAIKEYLPNDLAVRAEREQVLPKSPADQTDFDWGLERFLEEARALAQFDHPNIIRVHRFFQANGTGYIVMDYAEGETLSELLERERVLSASRLKALLYPLLDGLEAMHRMNFLHRDIKPSNVIILKKDGSPVIIDFGAARQAINAKSRSVTAIITPGYAPIEQYSTRGEQGPATDIYSLAAVAYRAIVGSRPDDATNRLTDDKLEGWTHRVRGWNPALLESIDKGLAFDKAKRPQTIAEWREMLSAGASTTRPTTKPLYVVKWRAKLAVAQAAMRHVSLRWALPALAGVALIVGIYWFWANDTQMAEESPIVQAVGDADEVGTKRIEAALAANAPDDPEALLAELNADHPQSNVLTQTAGDARAEAQKAATVRRLVAEANARIDDDEPAVAVLRAAVADLREALALDPGNADATAALQSTQDRYAALADDALTAASTELAEQWLDELELANSSHPELQSLRERTTRLARQNELASEIGNLLNSGSVKLASDQLMLPKGDNAVADFRRVLALDPDNSKAKAGLAAVEARYVELIRSAIRDESPERGRRLIANLVELNPNFPDAARLSAEIDAIGTRETASLSPSNPQPDPGAVETPLDEEDVLWNSVKDSCRKGDIERYCNAYPNGRHIEACWRRLSECLRQRASESG